jgi:hypothetical protein
VSPREEATVETSLRSTNPGRARAESAAFDSARNRLVADGIVAGLAGVIALAVPLVVWDWAHVAHRALELPMAVTAWLFGLQHFSHDQNLVWPIVIGTALLAVYGAVSGLAFAGLADRVFALESPVSSLVGGAAWGFVNFMLVWYMLLPIAREGTPFRATPADPTLSVAPNWVWILGFTLLGLVTGAVYAALHRSSLAESETRSRNEDELERKLLHAA